MAGVAELHVAGLEVDESDEHGDEHTLLVVLGEGMVHAGGDSIG